MRRNYCFSILAMAGLALGGGLTSCADVDLDSDEHYKAPDWLKGNAYEVLQKDGNHDIFLKGIDLSDYREIVAGKSIMTVIAPNDDAFRAFLSEKGYSSIEDLDSRDHDYLNTLIGHHLMYYAFNWDKMVNFRPEDGDGATEEEKAVGAGYFYKHRTHSIDPIRDMRVKLTANAVSDTLISVYHYERYLPVLSNKLFETKGIDAAYNYNYFFPDTKWGSASDSGKGCFNIANAMVTDKESVVTDNGYLYHVDHVLDPLNTIYDELAKNPDFSKFLSIYDGYSKYEEASQEVLTSLGRQVFVHSHDGIPNIAWEWPNLNWHMMKQLERDGYNVFAPTNKAIDRFFANFWKSETGYSKIEDLDPLILEYFIKQSFAAENFIVFPQEIKAGTVMTSYNTPIDIDPDQVSYRRLCCNGTLYGMDDMKMPAIFSSVVGPAFQDTTYQCYLYCLDRSATLLSLASKGTEFVTLMPSNEQMAHTDPSIRLYSTTSGKELQQYNSEAGNFVEMSNGAMKNITEMHVAQNVSSLKKEGSQVISTNSPYNYWFVKDGRITTNALFNQQLEPTFTGDPFVAFHPIYNNGEAWDNGNAYSYDAEAIFERAAGDGLGQRFATCQDKNFPYYMFAQLLQKAGLIVNGTLSPTLTSDDCRFIAFAPTNEAIAANLDKIPGCGSLTAADGTLSGTVSNTDKPLLAKYLSQYFINSMMNSFTDYPFLGSSCKGDFYTGGTNMLRITDTGSKLRVGFVNSTEMTDVTPDYSFLPFAFKDGCLHFIDGILQ